VRPLQTKTNATKRDTLQTATFSVSVVQLDLFDEVTALFLASRRKFLVGKAELYKHWQVWLDIVYSINVYSDNARRSR